MDKQDPHFNWWPLYEQFAPELAEITTINIDNAVFWNGVPKIV